MARYHGIAEAVRHMPYGIQQPAVSEQIQLLEEELGARLFTRRPFRLTPEGRFLYAALQPSMETMEGAVRQLQQRRQPHLRIGAEDGLAQSLLFPAINPWLKAEPSLTLDLQFGSAEHLKQALLDGELDLLITTLHGPPPRGLANRSIATRPIVLLVPKALRIRSSDHFWSQKTIAEPLIAPAATHAVSQIFQQGLRRGAIAWSPRITTDSLAAIPPLVAAGHGVGITLDCSSPKTPPTFSFQVSGFSSQPFRSQLSNFSFQFSGFNLSALPLAGFDPVSIACLWRPPDTVRLQPLLRLIGAGKS